MKEIKTEMNHDLFYYSDTFHILEIVNLINLKQRIFTRITYEQLLKT